MQRPYLYYLFLAVLLAASACLSTQDKSIKQIPKKNKSESIFVLDSQIRDDESYKNIKGSLARLQVMSCGKFVHYAFFSEDSVHLRKPWLVNDGKDSIVHYFLPIGDRNKEGYWICKYQYLTSLPNSPIYFFLEKFEEVNRDTIFSKIYQFPKKNEINLDQILQDPKDYFSELDLGEIEKQKPIGTYDYVRKSLLHYVIEGELMAKKIKNTRIEFIRQYLDFKPKRILLFKKGYGIDSMVIRKTNPEHLIREARVRDDYF